MRTVSTLFCLLFETFVQIDKQVWILECLYSFQTRAHSLQPCAGKATGQLPKQDLRSPANPPNPASPPNQTSLNGGVRLACEEGKPLEALKALVKQGVSLYVCGTCLTHYGLMDAKKVGETTNMLDIVTSLAEADKVIRP